MIDVKIMSVNAFTTRHVNLKDGTNDSRFNDIITAILVTEKKLIEIVHN